MKRIPMLFTLLAAELAATTAFAHAFLDHAVPAVGTTVTAAPKEVRMFYTEAIEPNFSAATLGIAGQTIPTSAAMVDPQNPMELVLKLPPLRPGHYQVSWHVVSTDTHRTEGAFGFDIRP
jgi:copper resistance protein C